MTSTTPQNTLTPNDTDLVEISEGCARMFYNKNEAVFYNKIQVFNRDISIQTIRLFADTIEKERNEKYSKKQAKYIANPELSERAPQPPPTGITVLDALAATGLRSVRYLKEIPGVRHVTINDLEQAAVEAAAENCKQNDVDMSRVTIHHGDASIFMYEHRQPKQQYDVIDLDPYGTAVPFLDSAVQAVSHGGLLCVTCTDMPTLAGNYPDVCFAKYGSMPLKARFVHEMSLRILLHAIDAAANKYKRHIVPWVSLSVDFYVRVFVRVYECPAEVKKSSLKRAMVLQSTQCPSFYLQPVGFIHQGKKEAGGIGYTAPHFVAPAACTETGGNLKLGGPFWSDPIHSQSIVDELLRRVETVTPGSIDLPYPVPTIKRVTGVLTAISEEVKDAPFYCTLPDLAATLHSTMPTTAQFHAALVNAGYQVSQFHHDSGAVKTNAPMQVIWDIMRTYCQLNPPVGSNHKKVSEAAIKILANEIKTPNIDFTIPESMKEPKKKAARFAPNPEENWGPKRRAGRLIKESAASVSVVGVDTTDKITTCDDTTATAVAVTSDVGSVGVASLLPSDCEVKESPEEKRPRL